ncbi:hypothetical protein CPB84DRAFT_863139 [Gymnopilus junonius]|uniref:RING-type domain-containing protein n=1 Tax=Gymnopilus junonius TaxID=109634 RepID=A0A9P5NMT4_GYMJU|nr:hypothetical protein CPB84DRAFT_863139 [Gymnopilus junonius]
MPVAHCPICFNHFPIGADKPEIVIFPCGHGYCKECTGTLFGRESRTKCPQCRTTIHRRDGHPVHLELVDSTAHSFGGLIDGFNQMNHTTPLVSVRRASQKLSRALQGPKPDDDAISALARAINGFEERSVPLHTTVRGQEQEIDGLRKNLNRSHRDRDQFESRAKSLQEEVDRLTAERNAAIRERDEAIHLAEIAKDDFVQNQQKAEHYMKQAGELAAENHRFKDQLDRHVNSARSQKEKNKKLAKQVESLTKQLADREPVSDATHGYDGDFSTNEHSRVHSSFSVSSTSIRSPSRRSRNDENEIPIELDFDGMPPPTFASDWQLQGSSGGLLRKRNPNAIRRNAGPIDLDRKGYPTRPIQLGPRNIIRISR